MTTLSPELKNHLLALVPPDAPQGLKLNWNAKTKRWYYFLSKIQYSPEKKRGVDHRLTVGYEKDGTFFYTKNFLLTKKAAGESLQGEVEELSKSMRQRCRKTLTDKRLDFLVVYPMDIVFIVAFLACLSGATNCMQIADYWKTHRRFFEKLFEDFPKKDISHDTIRAVLMLHKPKELERLFEQFTSCFISLYSVRIVGVDGQAVAATRNSKKQEKGRYLLNVYDITNGIALGQRLIAKKSNEIPAGQSIIKTMDLNGCVVTADAMHTQTKTAGLIIDQGGNYCLAVKQNQGKLYEYLQTYFTRPGKGVLETLTQDEGHDRIEERRTWALSADLLPKTFLSEWEGLEGGTLVKTQARRITKSDGNISVDDRYFICSLDYNDKAIVHKVAHLVRRHWGIENELHHVLDVNFQQDAMQCKRPTYIRNRALLNKLAHNVHSQYLKWLEKHNEPLVSRARLKTLLSTPQASAECWFKVLQKKS